MPRHDVALAYAEHATDLAVTLGDAVREADGHINTARALLGLGKIADAEQHLARAYSLATAAQDSVYRCKAQLFLGHAAAARQEWQRSLDYCSDALTLVQEYGDEAGYGVVLTNMGRALIGLRRWDEAKKVLEQALRIHRFHGNRGRAGVPGTIGGIERLPGRYTTQPAQRWDARSGLKRTQGLLPQSHLRRQIPAVQWTRNPTHDHHPPHPPRLPSAPRPPASLQRCWPAARRFAPTVAPRRAEASCPAATSSRAASASTCRPEHRVPDGIGAAADPGCSAAVAQLLRQFADVQRAGRAGRTLAPTPDLAASWQPNADGAVWRFTLRPDVGWTDGQPVTAHDFEWAVKRNLAPDLYCGGQYWQLVDLQGARAFYTGETKDPAAVGIRAVDDRTLEVTLENPSAYFINLATLPSFMALPRQVIEKVGDQAWTQPENIVRNGPFRLTEWVTEKQMVFEPNPGYHGGPPGVDRLVVNMIRQESTALAAYEAGELDMVEVPPAELARVNADPRLGPSTVELRDRHHAPPPQRAAQAVRRRARAPRVRPGD